MVITYYPNTSFLCSLYREQIFTERTDAFMAQMPVSLPVSSFLLLELRQSVRFQARLQSLDKTKGYPKREADQMLRDLDDLAKHRYLSPGLRVLLHLGLGEKDKALDWLEKCYEEQDPYCWSLKVLPIFDPLRTEPRFQALLKKVFPDP